MEGENGELWRYSASGIGILPTYDEQKIIQGVVNTDTSTFISFRNPFKEKIQVIISLETSAHENVFQLIVKNKRIEIEPLGLVSIPIVFIPKFN
jgi:ABC-type tungstate transport system permease subunit